MFIILFKIEYIILCNKKTLILLYETFEVSTYISQESVDLLRNFNIYNKEKSSLQ